MNVKYIFLLCFTIHFLVITNVAGEPNPEKQVIDVVYDAAIKHLDRGSLTAGQLVKMLGSNASLLTQYSSEKRLSSKETVNISRDLFEKIVKYVSEKTGKTVSEVVSSFK
ncbi:uncharacterized protein LOC126846668 [Adelges cooleyi]|uniref:uncharacterized protein LOC126846668 n=1 Tax=Adelges cooleyi TaxID=133065 RepID=UPI0021803B43|nr:uncharacterized protein LOC126846668 [Adelges cooleyi]